MNHLTKKILFEQETTNSLERIYALLKFNKMYTKTNKNSLDKIVKYSESQIIDFNLLERGLKKVLKMKGTKSKNVSDFFKKLLILTLQTIFILVSFPSIVYEPFSPTVLFEFNSPLYFVIKL